jgi:hypothetical protein
MLIEFCLTMRRFGAKAAAAQRIGSQSANLSRLPDAGGCARYMGAFSLSADNGHAPGELEAGRAGRTPHALAKSSRDAAAIPTIFVDNPVYKLGIGGPRSRNKRGIRRLLIS